MFTGIIESLGEIVERSARGEDVRLSVRAVDGYLSHVGLGDSVAVSGICLTVQEKTAEGFIADVSTETLSATTSGQWTAGTSVNLEKALTANKPLGGHLVSGHVDGVGELIEKTQDARSWRLLFEAPKDIQRFIARKGSITIDGISLTVNEVSQNRFGVNIIPHTMDQTTLGGLAPGDRVNLEVDQVARYLDRLIAEREFS